jgi:CO dehydrogenase/acetyl-CoA synthase epsilon subunit
MRLYGTELIIKSPEILSKYNNPILILKNSSFDEEIRDQVFKINSSINILSF